MKIKKGDKVQIIKGKDRVRTSKTGKGNQGKVLAVNNVKGVLLVEGLNLRFKHVKPRKEGEKGQRIEVPGQIKISNVMLVCPKCSTATRVGYKLLSGDTKGAKKVRICKKCGEAIE